MKVKPVMSTKTILSSLLANFTGSSVQYLLLKTILRPLIDLGNLEQFVRLRSSEELLSDDQHIVNAVDHLFSYAFDQRASDIHIEPNATRA
jgi:general secretion pathway protein E